MCDELMGGTLTPALLRRYRKCVEYRVVHRGCAENNRTMLAILHCTSLTITTLITVALVLDKSLELMSDETTVPILAGVFAAVVSAMTSWTKFAR